MDKKCYLLGIILGISCLNSMEAPIAEVGQKESPELSAMHEIILLQIIKGLMPKKIETIDQIKTFIKELTLLRATSKSSRSFDLLLKWEYVQGKIAKSVFKRIMRGKEVTLKELGTLSALLFEKNAPKEFINILFYIQLEYQNYNDLLRAVINDRLDLVKLKLPRIKIRNIPFSSEQSLLNYAIEKANIPFIQMVLEHGARIDESDLLRALSINLNRGYQIIKLLIDYGADVTARTSIGNSYLFFTENPQIVKLLLHYGADPNQEDNNEFTKLMIIAAQVVYYFDENKYKIAELLLEYGADSTEENAEGDSALSLAVKNNNRRLVTLILDYADPGTTDGTVLQKAYDNARKNNYNDISNEISKWAKKNGINLNK